MPLPRPRLDGEKDDDDEEEEDEEHNALRALPLAVPNASDISVVVCASIFSRFSPLIHFYFYFFDFPENVFFLRSRKKNIIREKIARARY